MYCAKCVELGWNPPERAIRTRDGADSFCLFHADIKSKNAQNTQDFNGHVFERIQRSVSEGLSCNLSGTIFPSNITFGGIKNFPPVNFSQCQFFGSVTFQEIDFQKREGTIFSRSKFFNNLSVRKVAFLGDLRFDFCFFGGMVSFKNIAFTGDTETSFNFSIFKKHAAFRFSRFISKSVEFNNAKFEDVADFFGCSFEGDADFTGSTFNAAAYFTASRYEGKCCFQRSTFNGPVDFAAARFQGKAIFKKVKFNENANADFSRTRYAKVFFKDVFFNAPVDFSRIQVEHSCFFIKTNFSKEAVFSESRFCNIAVFLKVTFSKLAQFDRAAFQGVLVYKKTIFLETALFLDCVFPVESDNNKIEFSYCHVYEQHKIRIHDTNLGSFRFFNIDISSFKFENCTWPKDDDGFLSVYEEKKYVGKDKNKKIESVFRSLKKNAISSRSEFQASDWHYKEKKYAYKNLLVSRGEIPAARYLFFRFFYKAYEISSGFGERPAQALLVLLVLFFTLGALQAGLALQEIGYPWNISGTVVLVAVKKWISCIPFVKLPVLSTDTTVGQMSLSFLDIGLSFVGQVLLAIQATLFALALRNRFRR